MAIKGLDTIERILVFGPTTSRVGKILWTLGEIGAPFVRDERSILALKQDASYLALNPKGTVPTLLVADKAGKEFVVNESNSCVAYLASKLSPGALYPSCPEAVANAWQWLEWGESTAALNLSPIWTGLVKRTAYPSSAGAEPIIRKSGDGFAELVNGKSVPSMLHTWRALEDHLAARRSNFVQGDQLTIADITVGIHTNRLFHLPPDQIGLDPRLTLPRTFAYYQRLSERSPFRTYVVPFGAPS